MSNEARSDVALPPDSAGPDPEPAAPAQSAKPSTAPKSSIPTAKPAGSVAKPTASGARPAGSGVKSAVGLSGLTDENLERTIIRRGLATAEEIEACKQLRAKLAAGSPPAPPKGLLDVMVGAKAITATQAQRLVRDLGQESMRKTEIPGYQIIDRLGKGSMGIVYKARQTSVDRIVAVKVLLDVLAKNREFIKRFEREAKIAARLSHNNIVNAIDAGTINGLHYFVMEFVEGKTIKDVLEAGDVYGEADALRVALAVADALKHAHERGLIHRDIKPENIILTKDGGVKLADLGLARLTADEKWAAAEAGMAIGTPYYISPEQVRGATDVDIRSDIYSLGATLYHMVTGRVPFAGDNPTEVMKLHVDKNATFTPPDHINPELSSGLGVVIETMMSRNRDQRYRTPADLIIDLKCLMRGEPPMLAEQKSTDLAGLAEAEDADEELDGGESGRIDDAEREEIAGYVNGRTTVIAILGILLLLSIASNAMLLAMK